MIGKIFIILSNRETEFSHVFPPVFLLPFSATCSQLPDPNLLVISWGREMWKW